MKTKLAVEIRAMAMTIAFAVVVSLVCGAAPQDVRPGKAPGKGGAKTPATAPAQPPPAASQPDAPAPITDKLVYVQFTTNKGPFILELNHEKAPITVENFVKYVDSKFYDGTIFHRITKSGIHVIQGGGTAKDGSQKPTNPPIKNEWKNGLTNDRGTISMARLGGQADSATSQFFINVQTDSVLDQPNDGAAYAVFGKIAAGMKVIDALYATAVQANPAMRGEVSQPVEPLIVEKAERISAAKAKEIMDAEMPATSQPAESQPAKGGH